MNKEILIDASRKGGFRVYIDDMYLEGVKSIDGADCTGDVIEVNLTIMAENLTSKLPTGEYFDLGKSIKGEHKRRKIPNGESLAGAVVGKNLINEVWGEFEESIKRNT